MAYDLGVDLGTAYTCAAVARAQRVEVFQLGTTSNLIPSVVSVRPDGTVLTGEAADRRAVTDPARTVREFKRRFGDDAPYVIGGVPYGAESLVGQLLSAVREAVSTVEGAPPDRVALTHPADYGPFKLDLLRQAARLAGIDDALLVPEPVAAAFEYDSRERVPEGEHLLVYDLGGGTFDSAVVRMDAAGPEVVGTPEGLARLGGIDFDQAVLTHVEAATGGAVTALDSTDPDARAALARLRADCRTAKEALSSDTETEIPVLLPQLRTSVRLTREELEAMVAPRLTDTARVLERVVASAGLAMDDIATVLLVGGSSRMPVVAQLVREHTGRPVAVDANPKSGVAVGAAMLAARAATPEAVPAGAVAVAVINEAVTSTAAATPTATEPTAPAPAIPQAASDATEEVAAPVSATRPRRRLWPLIAGVAALALVAIVAVAVLAGGGDSDAPDTSPPEDAPAVTATIPVGQGADHAAAGSGRVWITNRQSNTVVAIDPATNASTTAAQLDTTPHAIVVADGSLWLTTQTSQLLRVEPGDDPSNANVTAVELAASAAELAEGEGAVWASVPERGELVRVDRASNQVIATIPVGAIPDAVAVGGGGVWVANRLATGNGTVTRIDPANNQVVSTIEVGVKPDSIAFGGGSLWVANSGDGTVSRVDPNTNQVSATIDVGTNTHWVVVGADGVVWVTDPASNEVFRIDPDTNAVTATVTVGGDPEASVLDSGALWVVNRGDGTVSRVS